MATTTYYIRGDYDPDRDRERLLRETGQIAEHDGQYQPEPEDQNSEDLWESMQTFGVRRRLANAPRFVPAKVAYDPWNEGFVSLAQEKKPSSSTSRDGIADWYRSLTQGHLTNDARDEGPTLAAPAPTLMTPTATSPSKLLLHHSTAGTSHVSQSAPASRPSSTHPRPNRTNDRDWFISRALSAEASTALAAPTPASSTSLADILSRDPPINSQPLKPPVFLHLGPSNKGWAMLQSRGWREGEGLGASVVRREEDSADELDEGRAHDRSQGRQTKRAKRENEEENRKRAKGKGKAVGRVTVKEEELEGDDEIVEVKRTEVIDLTLSDSSSDSEPAFDDEKKDTAAAATTTTTTTDRITTASPALDELSLPDPRHSNQTSLLVPLPTILKSDRLGIGLKAKTEGPYRASVKRVTHNAAALKEHIQRGEETRRRKVMDGTGRRAFERAERRKSEKRREMLAYMNG